MTQPPLRPDQFDRYRRHLSLPEFGVEGQQRLLDAKVLLIGAGGLGCPLAQYLAAAGVGKLGLCDFDVVDTSNLQRQVLYGTQDVGRLKVEVARDRIHAMNPDVDVELYTDPLTSDNAMQIFADYDVIVDGTDNFPTRYLSNDACVLLGKPNVHGSIFRFDGQATVFDARRGPCYRCLFPEPPPPGAVPSCAEGGVLGVLPGLIAMIQATETVKLLAGIGEPLYGRLLQYDALRMEFNEFRLRKDPECPVCGENPSVTELIDYAGFCGVPAVESAELPQISAVKLKAMFDRKDDFLLLDVREADEFETAHIEGARLIPLGELETQLVELADWKDRPIVVQCKSGARSTKAGELLVEQGFHDVTNLIGGIEAWSLTVDPDVPPLLRTEEPALAKSKLPDAIQRRHLIDREMKPAQALGYAEAYLEQGRESDAIAFLVKAEATEQLEAMRGRAVEAGDAFLLRSVASAMGARPGRDEWRALARAAEAAGLERYAVEALRMAEAGED